MVVVVVVMVVVVMPSHGAGTQPTHDAEMLQRESRVNQMDANLRDSFAGVHTPTVATGEGP